MSSNEIPEGMEYAEVSAAKNVALDALETELEKQGFDLDLEDESPDLIDLADAVVEALIKAGVVIPSGLIDPHAMGAAK